MRERERERERETERERAFETGREKYVNPRGDADVRERKNIFDRESK